MTNKQILLQENLGDVSNLFDISEMRELLAKKNASYTLLDGSSLSPIPFVKGRQVGSNLELMLPDGTLITLQDFFVVTEGNNPHSTAIASVSAANKVYFEEYEPQKEESGFAAGGFASLLGGVGALAGGLAGSSIGGTSTVVGTGTGTGTTTDSTTQSDSNVTTTTIPAYTRTTVTPTTTTITDAYVGPVRIFDSRFYKPGVLNTEWDQTSTLVDSLAKNKNLVLLVDANVDDDHIVFVEIEGTRIKAKYVEVPVIDSEENIVPAVDENGAYVWVEKLNDDGDTKISTAVTDDPLVKQEAVYAQQVDETTGEALFDDNGEPQYVQARKQALDENGVLQFEADGITPKYIPLVDENGDPLYADDGTTPLYELLFDEEGFPVYEQANTISEAGVPTYSDGMTNDDDLFYNYIASPEYVGRWMVEIDQNVISTLDDGELEYDVKLIDTSGEVADEIHGFYTFTAIAEPTPVDDTVYTKILDSRFYRPSVFRLGTDDTDAAITNDTLMMAIDADDTIDSTHNVHVVIDGTRLIAEWTEVPQFDDEGNALYEMEEVEGVLGQKTDADGDPIPVVEALWLIEIDDNVISTLPQGLLSYDVRLLTSQGALVDSSVGHYEFVPEVLTPLISSITTTFGVDLSDDESSEDATFTALVSNIADGETLELSFGGVTYTATLSANKAVFTVPTSDLVALDEGELVATVTLQSDATITKSLPVDVDFTSPAFDDDATTISVDENIPTSQVIFTGSATDENSVSYSLSGDDAAEFSINSDGELTFKSVPDYESKSQYVLTLTAEDAVGNISEKNLTVNVSNIDDVRTAPVVNELLSTTLLPTLTGSAVLLENESLRVTVDGVIYSVEVDSNNNWSLDMLSATPVSGVPPTPR